MARKINRLTDKFCSSVKKPDLYPDGNNLYLLVGKSGSKSWLFRYALDGKEHWMGRAHILRSHLPRRANVPTKRDSSLPMVYVRLHLSAKPCWPSACNLIA